MLLLPLLLTSTLVFAQKKPTKSDDGISVEMSLGRPNTKITNPDNTEANYTGISTTGKGIIPLFSAGRLNFNLIGSLRYLDLKNTSTSAAVETSQMIGPGVGLELKYGALCFGYDYHYMKVRHQTTGPLASILEYDLNSTGYYVGLLKQINQLGVGVLYNQSTATIATSSTGFTEPSPFKDEVYWLVLRYNLGFSFGALLNSL
jgi:hypothetical protein